MSPAGLDTAAPGTAIGLYASSDDATAVDDQIDQAASTADQYDNFGQAVNDQMVQMGAMQARFQAMVAAHVADQQNQYASFQAAVGQHLANAASAPDDSSSDGSSGMPAIGLPVGFSFGASATQPGGTTGSGGGQSFSGTYDPATVNAIVSQAQQNGLDPALALATAMHESGLNPTAVGDNGTSFGLFQLHQGGELGNLSPQQAEDPATNASVALSTMAQFAKQNPGLSGGQLAAAAQRPADPQGYAAAVNALLPKAQAMLEKSQQGGGTTAPVGLPPGFMLASKDIGTLPAMQPYMGQEQPVPAADVDYGPGSATGDAARQAQGAPTATSLATAIAAGAPTSATPTWDGPGSAQGDFDRDWAGLNAATSDQPVAEYNQQAPDGSWQQVTQLSNGQNIVMPTDAPSALQQAAYSAQNEASQGFTLPQVNFPLLASNQVAQNTPGDIAAQQMAQPGALLAQAPAAPAAPPAPVAPAPNATAVIGPQTSQAQPVNLAMEQGTGSNVADIFRQFANFLDQKAGQVAAGVHADITKNITTPAAANLATGTPSAANVADLIKDLPTDVGAELAGSQGSPSLPPNTLAPGKLQDPYEATGVSKVPFAGGAVREITNPLNFVPMARAGEGAAAASDVASDVAEATPDIERVAQLVRGALDGAPATDATDATEAATAALPAAQPGSARASGLVSTPLYHATTADQALSLLAGDTAPTGLPVTAKAAVLDQPKIQAVVELDPNAVGVKRLGTPPRGSLAPSFETTTADPSAIRSVTFNALPDDATRQQLSDLGFDGETLPNGKYQYTRPVTTDSADPANFVPADQAQDAVAARTAAVQDVAEAASDFASSGAGRNALPPMGGGAVSYAKPSLLARIGNAVAGKAPLDPDDVANRVANAIQTYMASPNLAGVRNVRGAITMNGAARASWDVAGDMLANALEDALPNATERSRIVTEFNDPAARATWTPDMHYWADYWTKAERSTSQIAKDTGVIENMLPDYMARLAKRPDGSAVEPAAFSDYVGASKARQLPTYQDFAAAIQAKGLEPVTDLAEVMRGKVSSLGNAIENSRLAEHLENMPAADGKPVLAKQTAIGQGFGAQGQPGRIILGNKPMAGYSNVYIPGMGIRLVNNTAIDDLQDVIKPVLDNPVYQGIAKFNRGLQWGLMYNPLVHTRNVMAPAMAGSGGWDALALGVPVWRQGMEVLRTKPEDVMELVRGGLSLSANRVARQHVIDALIADSPDTNVFRDLASKIPAKEGLDHLLWDGIVQPVQVGTAVRLRDQFLKRGLSRDDAVRAASEAANTMYGQLPAATLSRIQRQAGSLFLFAKNWTFGNLRVLRYATYNLPGHAQAGALGGARLAAAMGNLTRNVSPVASHLTPEAEAAVADAARRYLLRSFIQGAVSHAAMNIALTGHDQFSNGPKHVLDLGWRDQQGVEHYSTFPFYKQEQDYLGYVGAFGKNPVRTVINRSAVPLQVAFEAGEPFINTRDAGKDGPFLHAIKVALHGTLPFGLGNLVNPDTNYVSPDQPGALDVLGTNAKYESVTTGRSATRPSAPRPPRPRR